MHRSSASGPNRIAKTLLVAALLALAAGTLGVAWLLSGLPSIAGISAGAAPASTILYDRYGRVLYEIMDPYAGRTLFTEINVSY